MKTCPRCGIKKWRVLSTGQIRYSKCGLTRKVTKNLWKKSRISPYWKGRLLEYFCLGAPAYRLRFQVPYSQLTIQRCFRMFRETIYYDNIKDLKPLSGEIEMDETMFSGRRPGKSGWGASGKNIVFGIYQRNGKVLTFPISSRAKEIMQPYITRYTKEGSLYYTDDWFAYAFLPIRGNHMEMLLDVYKWSFDPKYPVVCMDESLKQLIEETKIPIAASPGHVAKHDYEYKRCGVCNIFMASEPLAEKRIVKITERKTKNDWAYFLEDIAASYHVADKITLVMDNLNTHTPGALYETFKPDKAKSLWNKFEFIYTPKHGRWLNMAEIELNVFLGQCLNRRIDNVEKVMHEAAAWQSHRNNKNAKVNWQFTTDDARIKLSRLYPSIET